MSLMLIVREEIVCMIVLLFLLVYNSICGLGKEYKSTPFTKVAATAMCHVAFDLITVCTVNADGVPHWLNKTLQIAFYLSLLLFMCEVLVFICENALIEKKRMLTVKLGFIIPLLVYLILAGVLPMEIKQGEVIYYCGGAMIYAGYGMYAAFCAAAFVLIIVFRKRLPLRVVGFIVPGVAIMLVMTALQLIFPEILFTGAGISIVTAGAFMSVNPVYRLKEKAYRDANTGVFNRNAYSATLDELTKCRESSAEPCDVAFVMCDMNDLKKINDNYGHAYGDAFLYRLGRALTECMKSGKGVYRTGGDEFLVIYVNVPDETIKAEIEVLHAKCRELSKNLPVALSVAVGYAKSGSREEQLSVVEMEADKNMYINKNAEKKVTGLN